MTVRDLIAELLNYDMDNIVMFRSGSMEVEIDSTSQKEYEVPYMYLRGDK